MKSSNGFELDISKKLDKLSEKQQKNNIELNAIKAKLDSIEAKLSGLEPKSETRFFTVISENEEESEEDKDFMQDLIMECFPCG